jgi:phosphohistidine phosphatase
MRLYLVRHAKATPGARGAPDELRELTPKGQKRARELGMDLAAAGVRPAVILTSPLVRARQTADELGRALGTTVEVDERLAPGATADSIREAVAGRGEVVMTVGHQPDCGLIAAAFTGGPPPDFPTAGVVAVELDP